MYRTSLFFSISCLVLLIISFASAGELNLMSDAKGNSLHIGDSGTLNANEYKLDIDSGGISIYGTFNAGSSEINCGGNWTLDSEGTFTASTSTVVLDGDTQTISGSPTFYALKSSGQSITMASNLQAHSLNIEDSSSLLTNGHTFDIGSGGISIYGTFNAGSSEIQCGGNWTLDSGGTFTASTSTVVFDGSSQTISGSATFYGLKKIVSAMDTLSFDHNGTQTITGSLDLQGVADNLLHLRSTLDGNTFGITYSGEESNATLSYLNVKDSDASGGNTLTAMHSVDEGNNTNWSFIDMIVAHIESWLEGAYDVASHSMRTTLRDNSWIPNQSPYDADPITVGTIPDDVTDWVLVELRETEDGPAVASKSMFLKSDGDIISTTGDAPEFSDLDPDDYFVVVRHRNHLAIMSRVAHTFVAQGGTLLTLNLKDAANVYGENSVKELETDVWGMYTGDSNGNGQIQTNDKNDEWWPQVGQSGYKNCDFNLDCEVQTSDKNDCWWPNVGIGTQVP